MLVQWEDNLEKVPRRLDTYSIYSSTPHFPLKKPKKFTIKKKFPIPSSKLNSLQNFCFLADFQPDFATMIYTSNPVDFTGAAEVKKVDMWIEIHRT